MLPACYLTRHRIVGRPSMTVRCGRGYFPIYKHDARCVDPERLWQCRRTDTRIRRVRSIPPVGVIYPMQIPSPRIARRCARRVRKRHPKRISPRSPLCRANCPSRLTDVLTSASPRSTHHSMTRPGLACYCHPMVHLRRLWARRLKDLIVACPAIRNSPRLRPTPSTPRLC